MATTSNEIAEMYIKTIWTLSQIKGNAKTTEVSSMLKVVPSSASEMIQKLKKEGYLTRTDYKGCQLTKKGTQLALKLIRKERLLKTFLHEILNLPKDKSQEQACRLEHYIAKETEESLCKFLGCPNKCTVDNMPIPRCHECHGKH